MRKKSPPLKVLHVASFAGNVGDNISHLGLRRLVSGAVGRGFVEEQLEIRRTYLNYSLSDRLVLDASFAEVCRPFDLIVFGGGNLLEPFAETSSGTRLSFDRDALARVSVPILFASIGMVSRSPLDSDPKTAEKHRATMSFLAGLPNLAVVLRNDGSPSWLERHYPSISKVFQSGLDAGFFAPTSPPVSPLVPATPDMPIALNLSLDQMESALAPGRSYEAMIENIAGRVTERLESSNDNFMFIPHVHHDLKVFSDLMERVPDFYARSRISVSSLHSGQKGGLGTIRAYEMSKESWSMRFHSAISAIIAEKPLLPLVVMNRLDSLLDSVGFGGERINLLGDTVSAGFPRARPSFVSAKDLQPMKESTQRTYRESLLRMGVS